MEKGLIEELLSKFDLGEDAFIVIPIKSKEIIAPKEEPKPAPKAEKPKKEEAPSISRETVREALLNAKRAGVKVKDIMSKYVPEGKDSKFDNVPTSSYEELMKEITEYAV